MPRPPAAAPASVPAPGPSRPADDLVLAANPGLAALLGPAQLGDLLAAGHPLWFADPAITPEDTPTLWRYLRAELSVPELAAADVVSRAGAPFLTAQPDAWLARYYGFLHTDTRLWRTPADPDEPPAPARTQPIIRLEDGRQVPAFDADGHPVVYPPDPLAPITPATPGPLAPNPPSPSSPSTPTSLVTKNSS